MTGLVDSMILSVSGRWTTAVNSTPVSVDITCWPARICREQCRIDLRRSSAVLKVAPLPSGRRQRDRIDDAISGTVIVVARNKCLHGPKGLIDSEVNTLATGRAAKLPPGAAAQVRADLELVTKE